jgi:hypothetical protein
MEFGVLVAETEVPAMARAQALHLIWDPAWGSISLCADRRR